MGQVVVYFGYFRLQPGDELVRLVLVELQDAGHLDFHQLQNIVLGHFADELRVEGSEPFVDVLAGGVHVLGLFEFLVLVDTFFDEYLLQRGEVQGLQGLAALDVQFLAEQPQGIVDRLLQYRAH